jgi:uncharacterized protein YndB with AHSA1/START domain
MASVSATLDVTASAEQVWAVLSDPTRFSSWVDNHEGFVGDPPTEFAPGQSFVQRVRVIGMPADIRWTVDAFEEPRRLGFSGHGPLGIGLKALYLVDGSGSGSTITATTEFSGAAVMAVAGQLESEVGASQVASLKKLQSLVEE